MRTRAGLVVPLVACIAWGCGDERAGSAVDRDSSTVAASGITGVPPAWRIIPWEPYAGVDPQDVGVGVVYLRRAEDKAGTLGTDTLVLHVAPNASSPTVGAMLLTVSQHGVVSYAVAASDSIRPNLAEYGYEESGVPFDSVDSGGRWVRAILGVGRDSTPYSGWVDTSRPGVGTVRWVDLLADRPLFYPKPERAAFFASPDSSRPVPAPAGGDDEYAMHPEETRGPWMRVRLVVPSDNCTEPDSVRRQTRRAWIRYLDPRGRPNVWYYTRGC